MENFKELMSLCKCSVTISVNPHKDYYESVEAYLQSLDGAEVENDVMQEMINKDVLIQVQAYPETPIGFFRVFHYDVEIAIDEALKRVKSQ